MRTSWLAALLVIAAPLNAFADAPPALREAGVTDEDWERLQQRLARVARARDVSQRALETIAERLAANEFRGRRIDQDELISLLDERAQVLRNVQHRLDVLRSADDPTVASLLSRAYDALVSGDLDQADLLLGQAAERDLAMASVDEARSAERLERAERTRQERALLSGGNTQTAVLDPAEYAALEETWRMYMQHGYGQLQAGMNSGDHALIREAITVFQELAAPAAQPGSENWGTTYMMIGLAETQLQSIDGRAALTRALIAYDHALSARDRQRDAEAFARTQQQRASVLMVFGQSGDNGALAQGIEAMQQAIDATDPIQRGNARASMQVLLCGYLRLLGERGLDDTAYDRAVAACESALDHYARSEGPPSLVGAYNNLADVLSRIGERDDNAAVLRRSIGVYERAVAASSRDRDAHGWADVQLNIGSTYRYLGDLVDDRSLIERALQSYRNALSVYDRNADAVLWATAHNNSGRALESRAQMGGGRADYEAAAVEYRTALEVLDPLRDPELHSLATRGLERVTTRLTGQ